MTQKGKRKDKIVFVSRISETPMTQAQFMTAERMLAVMVARLIFEEHQRDGVESGKEAGCETGPGENSGRGSDNDE